MKNIAVCFATTLLGIMILSCGSTDPYKELQKLEYRRTTDLSQFVPYLNHEDLSVRKQAIISLGRLQDPASVDLLKPFLEEKNTALKQEAVFALGQLFSGKVEPLLLELLRVSGPQVAALNQSDLPEVRAAVCEALGKCGTEQALPALVTILDTGKEENIIAEALIAAGLLGRKKITSPEMIRAVGKYADHNSDEIVWRCMYALWRIADPAGKEYLETGTKSANSVAKVFAVRGLSALKDREAMKSVFSLMKDPDWKVRYAVLNALEADGGERYSVIYNDMLDDESLHIKKRVLQIFSKHAMTAYEKRIVKLLQNEDPDLEYDALIAMAQLNPGWSAEFVKLRSTDKSWKRRLAAAVALRFIDKDFAVGILKDMIADIDVRVYTEVLASLEKHLGLEAATCMIKALDRHDMAATTTAAGLLARHDFTGDISPFLTEYAALINPVDIEPKTAIIALVAASGKKEYVPFLETALGEGDRNIARAAAAALKTITGEEYSAKIPVNTTEGLFKHPSVDDPEAAQVEVTTARGTFRIAVYRKEAPAAAENFLLLVSRGKYDGTLFHRVVPNFVVQGGDPRGDGWGGPGYGIRCEYNRIKYQRGTVGMPLSGKDTGGCQLFICHLPQPHLDGKYTVYGQVTEGMDVVDQLQQYDVIEKMAIVR